MTTRFRPRLESLDARIVLDGDLPAAPGGDGHVPPANPGNPTPPDPGNPELPALIQQYGAALQAFAAKEAEYHAAIAESVRVWTHSYYVRRDASDAYNRWLTLSNNPAADPALQAAARAEWEELNARAGSLRIQAAGLWVQADNIYVSLYGIQQSATALRIRIQDLSPQAVLASAPGMPRRWTSDDVDAQARQNVQDGVGEP